LDGEQLLQQHPACNKNSKNLNPVERDKLNDLKRGLHDCADQAVVKMKLP
jgi:hypothetical protein